MTTLSAVGKALQGFGKGPLGLVAEKGLERNISTIVFDIFWKQLLA